MVEGQGCVVTTGTAGATVVRAARWATATSSARLSVGVAATGGRLDTADDGPLAPGRPGDGLGAEDRAAARPQQRGDAAAGSALEGFHRLSVPSSVLDAEPGSACADEGDSLAAFALSEGLMVVDEPSPGWPPSSSSSSSAAAAQAAGTPDRRSAEDVAVVTAAPPVLPAQPWTSLPTARLSPNSLLHLLATCLAALSGATGAQARALSLRDLGMTVGTLSDGEALATLVLLHGLGLARPVHVSRSGDHGPTAGEDHHSASAPGARRARRVRPPPKPTPRHVRALLAGGSGLWEASTLDQVDAATHGACNIRWLPAMGPGEAAAELRAIAGQIGAEGGAVTAALARLRALRLGAATEARRIAEVGSDEEDELAEEGGDTAQGARAASSSAAAAGAELMAAVQGALASVESDEDEDEDEDEDDDEDEDEDDEEAMEEDAEEEDDEADEDEDEDDEAEEGEEPSTKHGGRLARGSKP